MSLILNGVCPVSMAGFDWQESSSGWKQLWSFCHLLAPDLISEALLRQGFLNMGAGLDSRSSCELATRLKAKITSGQIPEYLDTSTLTFFSRFLDECGGFEIW